MFTKFRRPLFAGEFFVRPAQGHQFAVEGAITGRCKLRLLFLGLLHLLDLAAHFLLCHAVVLQLTIQLRVLGWIGRFAHFLLEFRRLFAKEAELIDQIADTLRLNSEKNYLICHGYMLCRCMFNTLVKSLLMDCVRACPNSSPSRWSKVAKTA